jgi:hypothetical protein
MKRRYIILGAIITAGVACASGAGDDVVEKMKRDFDARYKRFGRVRYQLEGTGSTTKGTVSALMAYKDPMPAADTSWPEQVLWVVDFANARFRKEARGYIFHLEKGVLANCGQFEVFDGKRQATFDPRELNTSLVKTPGPMQPDVYLQNQTNTRGFFLYCDYPILFAHGIVPSRSGQVNLLALRDDDRWNWFVHTGDATIDGRTCAILRYRNPNDPGTVFDEYWVDLEKTSAVIRWKSYYSESSSPTQQLEVDYQRSDHGWLPDRWTATAYISPT